MNVQTKIPIIKYIIRGSNIQQETINEILTVLTNRSLKIMHTSGIIMIHSEYFYELYFSDIQDRNISFFKNEITDIDGIDFVETEVISLRKTQ